MPRWVEPLRAAFAAGDPERLVAEYERARRSPLSGLPLRTVEAIYPVREIVHLTPPLDARIAAQGLVAASRWLLDTHFAPWRPEIPEATAPILASRPAVIYGVHGPMLTLFLVSAAVGREDLRIVSAHHVHHLLPAYRPYSVPVETAPRTRAGWREQLRILRAAGLPAFLQQRLLALLAGGTPDDDAKRENLRSLHDGARHVAGGGCLLIAPDAGIATSGWRSGIGRIVARLVDKGEGERVYLIPYTETHVSNRRMFASLRRGRRAQLRRRLLYRQPSTIRFAEPVLMSSLVPRPDDPAAITQRLQAHYRGAFPS